MAKTLRKGFILIGALAVACGGSESAGPEGTPPNTNTPNNPQVELSSLSIDLGSIDLTMALGSSADFQVEGLYSDGSTADLTAEVVWASSDPTVANFVAPGKLVTLAQGATQISVSYEGQSASEDLVIEAPTVVSLELDPPLAIKGIDENVGGGIAIQARATYSDKSILDVTEQVTWSSSNTAVGIMSAMDIGRLALFGYGEVIVTARLGDVEATGRYVATGPVVESIAITPKQIRVQVGGDAVAATVEGRLSDGSTVDLTNDVVWGVDDDAIALIGGGMVQPISPGNTYLRASYQVTVDDVTTELVADAEVRVVDASTGCLYPTSNPTLTYDDVIAPYLWVNAYNEKSELVDLSLEELHCDNTVSTVAFVIGAGWCPYCPAFKAVVDAASADLEELGMKVVYVEIETNTGAPASHSQANDIVNRTTRVGQSTRVGAFTEEEERPFARVPSLPNLVVIRTSDMKVIRRGRRDDLANMAANPGTLYGDAW